MVSSDSRAGRMKRRPRQVISSSSESETTDTEIGEPMPPPPAPSRQVNGIRRSNRPPIDLPSSDSSADDDLDSINSDHLFNPERDRRTPASQVRRGGSQQPQSVRQVNGTRGRTPVSASQPVGSNRNGPTTGRFPPKAGTGRPTSASQGTNQKKPSATPQKPQVLAGKEVRKKYSELIEICQGILSKYYT